MAIPFFRTDKLGVYNGAINLYGLKQINNCEIISDFYKTVIGQNQIEMTQQQQQLGNTTLFEQPVAKVRFRGAENPANVTTIKPVLNQLLAPIKEGDTTEFQAKKNMIRRFSNSDNVLAMKVSLSGPNKMNMTSPNPPDQFHFLDTDGPNSGVDILSNID